MTSCNDDDNNAKQSITTIRGSPASVLHTPPTAGVPYLENLQLHHHEENDDDDNDNQHESSWYCPASQKSLRTINPIRAIVDPIVMAASATSCPGGGDDEEPTDGKNHISLALGDPTVSGHLPTCPLAIDAVIRTLKSPGHAAGYVNALGTHEARMAIAKHHGASTADHVIVANGCSGALELALTALLDPGTVLLVPQPGFPLYQVIATSHGASVAHYNLSADDNWECDLRHMSTLVRKYPPGVVRGIVITNPSNPTGSVFSKRHLEAIVQLAHKLQLPLVADEVYGNLTFGTAKFHPLANVAADLGGHVPVITASGLAKQYLLPGWRVGWLVFQDSHNGALREVEAGAKRLAQVILGASHLAQSVVPALLDPASEADRDAIAEWKMQLKSTLEQQANVLCKGLAQCQGLSVHFPQGAMYSIVRVRVNSFTDAIQDDMDFTKLLLKEENVFVLPGRAFLGANDDDGCSTPCFREQHQQRQPPLVCFRIVFCASVDMLREAAQRISKFCDRHSVQE